MQRVRATRELDFSSMPADLSGWYRSHSEKINTAVAEIRAVADKPMPDIRAVLARRRSFGASAGARKYGYAVELNAALPTIIHFTFNNLLRLPTFMSAIGNAASETPEPRGGRRIPLSLPSRLKIEEAVRLITTTSRPEDDARAQMAVLLTELATAFCAYHEVAHVVLGHVDANARLSASLTFVEVVALQDMPLGKIASTRRVWEFEADLVAINMLLQDMLSPKAEEAFEPAYGPENDYSPLARIQAMLGAALIVFLLIAQVVPPQLTHPDPLVRFIAVADETAAALLQHHSGVGLTDEEIHDAINDVAAAILDGWARLEVPTKHPSLLSSLRRARAGVERLQRQRRALSNVYRSHAYFYPFE